MARERTADTRYDSGFTIVELLIVIVVIAILAAISIIAFTGVQTRAENTKTVAALQAYTKALQQYYIDNSDYPPGQSCLGVGYGAGGCRDDVYAAENQGGFNTVHLAPYIQGSPPTPSTKRVQYSTPLAMAGAAYYYIDGAGFGVIWLGSSTCPEIGSLKLSSVTNTSDGKGKLCRYALIQ